MSLHPYHKLRSVREEIYQTVKEAVLSEPDTAAEIFDGGLTLYIRMKEREFRITSEMKNGYQKLNLYVHVDEKNPNNPETFNLSEVPELKIRNEETPAEYGRRILRRSFIGDSLHPIDAKDIGNEFKIKLEEYLSK